MTRLTVQSYFSSVIAFLSFFSIAHSAPPVPAQLAANLPDGTAVKSSNGQAQFATETSRPFSLAIEVLRVQYGAIICYEDPLYADPDDVVAFTHKGIRDRRIPAGGKFSLTYSADDVATVLKQLAQVRLTPDRGAHFHVVQTGSVYMFLPIDARDLNGNRGASQTPLDAHITMDAVSRPASETLATVLKLAADASKQPIVYMTPPGPDSPGDPAYKIGAQDETVRSVLLRALALMEPQKGPVAWDLFYDPDSRQYYMNFTAVIKGSRPVATPASIKRAVPSGGNAADVPITPH